MWIPCGEKNYRVSFRHGEQGRERLIRAGRLSKWNMPEVPTRYTTEVLVFDEQSGATYHGWSICSPLDVFNKATGRRLALADAISSSRKTGKPITKDTATQIWEHYFQKCKDGKHKSAIRARSTAQARKNARKT